MKMRQPFLGKLRVLYAPYFSNCSPPDKRVYAISKDIYVKSENVFDRDIFQKTIIMESAKYQ